MVATTHPVKQPADGGRLAVDSRCTASRSWSEVGKATANHRQSKPKRRHRRAAPWHTSTTDTYQDLAEMTSLTLFNLASGVRCRPVRAALPWRA